MLTKPQKEALYTINAYTYEQYDGIWCKAFILVDEQSPEYNSEDDIQSYYSVKGYQYSGSDQAVRTYLEHPFQTDHALSVIRVFLDDHLIDFTPESFCYNYSLQQADWQLISKEKAVTLMDQLLAHSKAFLKIAQQKAAQQVLEYLQYLGFDSKEAYENSVPKEQAAARLSEFYENYGLTPSGGPWIDFDEAAHDELRAVLLEQWWAQEDTYFFSSLPLDQVATCLKTEDQVVGIVGMDDQKLAFIWFN